MKKLSKFIRIAVILALIMAAAAFVLPASQPDARFRTEKASRGTISDVVNASGTLNPVQVVDVGTQISGKVSNMYVEVNQRVKEGELLAEIDPALLKATLKQSTSNLSNTQFAMEQAARDLARAKALLAKDFVAKVEVEKAELAYRSARIAYEVAQTQVERDKVNLDYTKIVSPVDGVIISKEANQGQTLAAGLQTPNLFKIAGDLTKMKIDVNLPESDIGRVKEGMKVAFNVDAFPDREFAGVVQKINLNPNNQQGVVTYTINVMVDNADRVLLPGMTAFVNIKISERPNVLRVPAMALRFTPPPAQVNMITRMFQPQIRPTSRLPFGNVNAVQKIYLLKSGQPVETPIQTGASDDKYIEVTSGNVAEGDDVITALATEQR